MLVYEKVICFVGIFIDYVVCMVRVKVYVFYLDYDGFSRYLV